MRIGVHSWEPGLAGDFLTAAPGWLWMQFLFEEMRESDHEPVWFGTEHDAPMLSSSSNVGSVDLRVFCWRWPMDSHPRFASRNRAYDKQM